MIMVSQVKGFHCTSPNIYLQNRKLVILIEITLPPLLSDLANSNKCGFFTVQFKNIMQFVMYIADAASKCNINYEPAYP